MASYKKILIGGYDFEQKIHRGITFYAKALTRSLNEKELYLLTSAKNQKEQILSYLNILRQLDNPNYLDNRKKIIEYIKFILGKKQEKLISNRTNVFDNKLLYLNNFKYYLNIYGIYDITTVHNRIFLKKPMKINLKEKLDYFITTSPMNISSNIPIIQTLHDVIPLTSIFHPPSDDSKIFYYRIKNMLEYSEKIISVSNFSKNALLDLFGNKYDKKIYVTYQPIPIYSEEEEISNEPIVENAILEKYNLKKDNYVFYVGMLERRKNIKRLLESYISIYDKVKIPLVLAGGLGYGKEEFKSLLNFDKDITYYIGYINNIEKLVLMKNSRAFIFPSLEEGFGLPPLEAMKFNTPVLTSNTTSLPEVCGNAALLINPYSLKDIADGIIEIVNNETLRSKLKKLMPLQVKKFSFNSFKDKINKVIN